MNILRKSSLPYCRGCCIASRGMRKLQHRPTAQGVTAEAALGDGSSVTLAVLNSSEIRSLYGSDPQVNPFIITYSHIGQRTLDYLVVRLTIDARSGLSAELVDAAAVDESGTIRSMAFDRSGFIEEAMALAPMIENQARREDTIRQNYIPAGSFTVNKGKRSWVIVLRGSHPFPPSLRVRVRGLINGTLQEMELPLPDGFTS